MMRRYTDELAAVFTAFSTGGILHAGTWIEIVCDVQVPADASRSAVGRAVSILKNF